MSEGADNRGSVRIATTGVVKAGIALGLMVVFFIGFFMAPGVTVAGALLLVVLFEILRRQ